MQKVTRNGKSCWKYEKLPKSCRATCGKPEVVGGGGGEGGSNKVYYGECASYEFVLIPLDFASLFKSGFQ